MKMIRRVLLFILMSTGLHAQASSVTYLLDQSYTLADGVGYAMVTLSDDTDGLLDIRVESIDSAFTEGRNFGFQSFSLNIIDGAAPSVSAADIQLPNGWKIKTNVMMSEMGRFDFRIAGTGKSRMDEFHFTIAGLGINDIDPGFAAHIAGFTESGNITSAFFGGYVVMNTEVSAVPLPGALWLFSTGTAMLGFVTRRQKQKSTD